MKARVPDPLPDRIHRVEDNVSSRLLAAYVEGDVSPSEAAAVERALAESSPLRRRAEGLRHIKEVLSSDIHSLGTVDLSSRNWEQLKADAERGNEAPGYALRRWWRWTFPPTSATSATAGGLPSSPSSLNWLKLRWAGGAAALATCASLGALLLMRAPQDDEFRAKSAGPGEVSPQPLGGDATRTERPAWAAAGQPAAEASRVGGAQSPLPTGHRWAGITAYHVAGERKPARLGPRLPMGDGLLFSYSNAGPDPFAYLMICAVDASGEVRWFFPAYEQEGSNPASIAIDAGKSNVSLPVLLHHDWPPGPLTVVGLFSRRPLRVLEVEAWLKHHRGMRDGTVLPWSETHQHVIVTSVER